MSNPFVDILTPTARKYLYAGYALVGTVLGAAQILGADWAAPALAVYAFVGTAFGITANSNVDTTIDPDTEEFVDDDTTTELPVVETEEPAVEPEAPVETPATGVDRYGNTVTGE